MCVCVCLGVPMFYIFVCVESVHVYACVGGGKKPQSKMLVTISRQKKNTFGVLGDEQM